MKTISTVFGCLFFASAAHAGFFERLHNNIDEGVRELCARKPDLCKRVDADQNVVPRHHKTRRRSGTNQFLLSPLANDNEETA